MYKYLTIPSNAPYLNFQRRSQQSEHLERIQIFEFLHKCTAPSGTPASA